MNPDCNMCGKPAAGEFKPAHKKLYRWYCLACLIDEKKKRNMLRLAKEKK